MNLIKFHFGGHLIRGTCVRQRDHEELPLFGDHLIKGIDDDVNYGELADTLALDK